MSLRQFEAKILQELKVVAKDKTIRQKDIMEWSTGKIKAVPGEILVFLPENQVWAAFNNKENRKKK